MYTKQNTALMQHIFYMVMRESAATYTDTAGESFLRFQERSLQMKVR